uniref:Amidase domain-containing protein n=1 Tax=Parascaris equorum TaxID=6256 RepID=A0A914S0M8_PAREQ
MHTTACNERAFIIDQKYAFPFRMKGYDCCIGLAKNLFEQMDSECTLVTHLRCQGAIPFVLTNVPQALLSFVCSNPVYGTTSHPSDSKRVSLFSYDFMPLDVVILDVSLIVSI